MNVPFTFVTNYSWFHITSSKLKKQGIINPFEILVLLVIRTSEDLSFETFSV